MTKFLVLFMLAILIGIIGGVLSYREKTTGELSYAGLAVLSGVMWIAVSLFFWWFSKRWLLIPISIVFITVLVMSILKCVKPKF